MDDGARGGAPRGRRREADRNDVRLMRAARAAFAELGWDAPVSEIARRAGIGMGSLYRRYPSKEALAQRMRVLAMDRLTEQATAASARHPDPWTAFTAFLRDAVSDQEPGGPLLRLLGGRLPSTGEVAAAAARLRSALDALVAAAHEADALRRDVGPADVPLLLELLSLRIPAGAERSAELRSRYLELVLDGLRAPASGDPLTGPAPEWRELHAMWNAL